METVGRGCRGKSAQPVAAVSLGMIALYHQVKPSLLLHQEFIVLVVAGVRKVVSNAQAIN